MERRRLAKLYRLVYTVDMDTLFQGYDSKSNILQVALSLFSEKGYESVGVAQIADEAKITKPTLYYYFGSKEGVFKEILQAGYDPFLEKLEGRAAYISKPDSYYEDVFPVLQGIVEAYFGFVQENREFYRLALNLFFSCGSFDSARMYGEYKQKQYSLLEKLFQDFARTHKNMMGREKRYAWSFLGVIHTYLSLWYDGEITFSGETVRELVAQFMHGILS